MKNFIILLLIVLILFSGCCTTIPELPLANRSNVSTTNSLERSFIYQPPQKASGPVSRTIAEFSVEDVYDIYGTTNLTVNDCVTLDDPSPKFRCIRQAAIYLNDSSICRYLDDYGSAACYYYYSLDKADATGCSMIDDLHNRTVDSSDLSQSCRRAVALVTGDSSLCAYAPNDPEGPKKMELCSYFADSGVLVGKEECRDEFPVNLLSEYVYFGETYRWLLENHEGGTVLSWWDYGTTLDCIGLKSVVSHNNRDSPVVPELAYLLVRGNESELAAFMEENNASYVMIDSDLLFLAGALGGKYGALNYLSCTYMNETDENSVPGDSACEKEHLWETIIIREDATNSTCRISDNVTGRVGYRIYEHTTEGDFYLPYYPYSCYSDRYLDANRNYCDELRIEPAYCVGDMRLANGSTITGTYDLNDADGNGNLKLHKAVIGALLPLYDTHHFDDASELTLFYTDGALWSENGTLVDGYGDRTSAFYDSILYKAFFAEDKLGFDEVYADPTGRVKIFKVD